MHIIIHSYNYGGPEGHAIRRWICDSVHTTVDEIDAPIGGIDALIGGIDAMIGGIDATVSMRLSWSTVVLHI